MSKHVKVLLALLVLGALMGLSLTSALAQPASVPCDQVGVRTGNKVLVDITGSAPREGDSINCTLINVDSSPNPVVGGGNNASVGLARTKERVPSGFDGYLPLLFSVDVYTLQPNSAAPVFGFFKKPVRVCFKYSGAASAVPFPEEPGNAENDVFLVFKDARYFRIEDPNRGRQAPARENQLLNVVVAGLELDYICGDIDTPGTVTLTGNIPPLPATDPAHPLAPLLPLPGNGRCTPEQINTGACRPAGN